jgi:cytochrome P450
MPSSCLVKLASPPGLPLLGHLPQMRRDMPGFLLSTARDYGPVCRFRMGPTDMILVVDPALVHEMLVKRASEFHKSRRTGKMISVHLGDGLLTLEGEVHRKRRRVMQPAMHTQRIASYGDIMVSQARQRVSSWSAGAQIDVVPEMADLALRIVADSLFTASSDPSLMQAVHDFARSINEYLLSFGLHPSWLPSGLNRRRRSSIARIDELGYQLIRRRRAGSGGADLLDLLISTELSDVEIRDELMTMFFAGHETSASALAWAFYELSAQPSIADRIVAELSQVLGESDPALADLPRLPYLGSVVKETLRRWPPGWLFDRTPVAPTTIGGYPFRPGQILYFSPYVIHLDPSHWDSPLEFRPSRFASGAEIPRETYLPFGDGPRMCLGNRFAEAEIALVLAVTVRRVRLTRVSDEPVVADGQATLRPKGGLRMTVSPR